MTQRSANSLAVNRHCGVRVSYGGGGAPANNPPVSSGIPDQSDNDADVINLNLSSYWTDADDDPMTYSAMGLPTGLSMSSLGVVTGTIDGSASVSSPYSVTMTADDGNGGLGQDTFNWTVANVVPVGTTISNASYTSGDAVSIDVSSNFTDADGDTLSFSATGLPTGITINSSSGVISGTLEATAHTSSPYSVTVTADDGEGGTADENFTITVSAVSSDTLEDESAAKTALGMTNADFSQAIFCNRDTDLPTYPTFNAAKTHANDWSVDSHEFRTKQFTAQSIWLDGNNDAIQWENGAGSAQNFDPLTPAIVAAGFTMCVRYCRQGTSNNARFISLARTEGGGNDHFFLIGITGTLPYRFFARLEDASGLDYTTTFQEEIFDDNLWHDAILEVDTANDEARLYKDDGVLVEAIDITNWALDLPTAGKMKYGGNAWTSSNMFQGGLQDGILVDRVLTADERTWYFTKGKQGTAIPAADMIFWHKMMEGGDLVSVHDCSGNERHFILKNATISSARTTTPAVVPPRDHAAEESYNIRLIANSDVIVIPYAEIVKLQAAGTANSVTLDFTFRLRSDNRGIVFSDGGSNRFMHVQSGSGLSPDSGFGTPTYYIDPVANAFGTTVVSPQTRDGIYDALTVDTPMKVRITGLDFSGITGDVVLNRGTTGSSADDFTANETIVMHAFAGEALEWWNHFGLAESSTYRFTIDESSSSPVVDIVGQPISPVTEGPVRKQGLLKQNNRPIFDGVNDYADLTPHLSNFASDTVGAFMGWVKTTDQSRFQCIWAASDSGDPGSEIRLGIDNGLNNKLHFSVRENNTWRIYVNSSKSVNTNQWFHIAIVMTASGLKWYINGVEEDLNFDESTSNGQWWFNDVSSLDAFGFGRNIDSGGGQWYYQGELSRMSFHTTLTHAQIIDNYKEKIEPASPKALWPMAEGEGTVFYDVSGNDYHATISNATLSTFWSIATNAVPWNLTRGYTRYTHATENDILVPYGVDGNPLTITVPSGYTKDADYPAGDEHNGAETKIDMTDGQSYSSFAAQTTGIETAYHPDTSDRTNAGNLRYASSNDKEHLYVGEGAF